MTDSDSKQEKSEILERPSSVLEGDAAMAWQAYNAMETTKQRHFELLETLDAKKKNYNIDPTDNDKLLLDCFLADHDQQVKQFTTASRQLKEQNTAAHGTLFEYIAAINQAASDRRVTH